MDPMATSSDAAAAAAADVQESSGQAGGQDEPNGVRFLAEPQDTYAVLGQPGGPLQCVFITTSVATTHRNATTQSSRTNNKWFRGPALLALNGHSLFPLTHFVEMERIALADFFAQTLNGSSSSVAPAGATEDALQQLAAPPGGQQQQQQDSFATSYTLRFANVTLHDEGQYRCSASGRRSLPGRFVVLQAPTELEIVSRQSRVESVAQQLQQDAQSDNSIEAHRAPQRIVARLNSRLSLECRAHEAKPRAELVWLDSQAQAVNTSLEAPDEQQGRNQQDQLEEFVQVEASDARLERTTLTYSFNVRKEHHNKLLTCQARHMAYELQQGASQAASSASARTRSVQIEVHYEPEIELVKDQLQPVEGAPLSFECRASARPPIEAYEWYLDERLVDDAQGPELRIARLTRQLYMREIKCCVRNSLGRPCVVSRLNMTYSPAYVTHLLPPSLQPAGAEQISSELTTKTTANDKALAALEEPLAGPQLALVVQPGADVTLRCDFDANPRPLQIEWFRLQTGWPLIKDVEPSAADELIAGGALRATFKLQQEEHDNEELSGGHSEQPRAVYSLELARRQQKLQVDLEQMSTELQLELKRLEEQQRRRAEARNSTSSSIELEVDQDEQQQLVEQLVAEQFVHTQARIFEPLEFEMRQRHRIKPNGPRARLLQQQALNLTTNNDQLEQDKELVLLSGPSYRQYASTVNNVSAQQLANFDSVQPEVDRANRKQLDKQVWRKSELASSSIVLRRANEDSMGKYVCRARSASQQTSKWFARAIQLVLKQSPRIVSVREQFAQLGARQLQLECLVQLNGIGANRTQFLWFRSDFGEPNSDRPIDFMRSKQTPGLANGQTMLEKSYTLIEERSPDLLFARSILRIHQAEFSDFGQYNCTVINSLGRDSIRISLQPVASTGLAFKMLGALTLGSLFVFFAFLLLVLLFVPCRRLDRQAMAKSAAVFLAPATSNKSQQQQQQQLGNSGPAAKRASNSATSSDDERSSTAPVSSGDEKSTNSSGQLAGQMGESRSIISAAASVATLNGTRLVGSAGSVRRACGASQSMTAAALAQRRPESALAGCLAHQQQQQQQQRRHNFAAIHESLEHKLQFGHRVPQQPPASLVVQHELSRPAGLLGKLWGKLNACEQADGGAQKRRPTISLPTSFRSTGGASSLDSTATASDASSLATLTTEPKSVLEQTGQQQQQQQRRQQQHSLNDEANLQQVNESALMSQHSFNLQAPGQKLATGHHSDSYWCLQAANQQQQSLYANYAATTQQQQQQQQVAWAPSVAMEQTAEHYQMPHALMSEQYLAAQLALAAAMPHQERPCYATICNTQQPQQHYATSELGNAVLVPTSDGGDAFFESNYGTLLSKSSAYKELGYGNYHQQNGNDGSKANNVSISNNGHSQQLGSNGTSATSPSSSSNSNASSASPALSLTTHAASCGQPALVAMTTMMMATSGGAPGQQHTISATNKAVNL